LYFPSKKDIWFFLIIWGAIIVTNFLPLIGGEPTGTQFISSESAIGRIFMIIITIPLIWIWFRTGYMIEDAKIRVKFGPIRWTIKINDIKKINKVKHPFTAPALSVNRLELLYGTFGVICLSPKNERKFIELLLMENPQIQLEEKLKY
jgi:hypothetical protein